MKYYPEVLATKIPKSTSISEFFSIIRDFQNFGIMGIEAFVLDLPAQASALIGRVDHIASSQADVGDPFVVDARVIWPRVSVGAINASPAKVLALTRGGKSGVIKYYLITIMPVLVWGSGGGLGGKDCLLAG